MRLFIAIEIDENLKGKILDIQDKFRKSEAIIKYVEKKNLHFNLKFIGKTDDSRISVIEKALENALKSAKNFKIHIFGSGAFPSNEYIRILWLGVKEGKKKLIEIARKIEEELEKIGFEKDRRGFSPHLTLGRVKSVKNKDKLKKILKELENIDIREMEVKEIILFGSELGPEGPVYTKIYSVKLNEG